MKNKTIILIISILVIIFCGVKIYASTVSSSVITYSKTGSNIENVEGALNDLYSKVDILNSHEKFCTLKDTTYGSANQVGSMYECDPGDGTLRNFYILTVNNDNTVDLLMQRNISNGTNPTMTWYDAMKYIDNNNLKSSWSNVLDIDLPRAQAIVDAVGRSDWIATENSSWWCLESKTKDTTSDPYCYNNGNLKTLWLWDYLRECSSWNCLHGLDSTSAYGYWTRDIIIGVSGVWTVSRRGDFDRASISVDSNHGVRPVITVLKANLKND